MNYIINNIIYIEINCYDTADTNSKKIKCEKSVYVYGNVSLIDVKVLHAKTWCFKHTLIIELWLNLESLFEHLS